MINRRILPTLVVLTALGLLVAYFPAGPFSWHRFLHDPSPRSYKLLYLLKVYVLPAVLSFIAVIMIQCQMRLSVLGAPVYIVFPVAVVGCSTLMAAFRTMVGGVGGVPGYALGMAAAYTLMSRFQGVRPSGKYWLGVETVRIVWRGDNVQRMGRPVPGPALERRAS